MPINLATPLASGMNTQGHTFLPQNHTFFLSALAVSDDEDDNTGTGTTGDSGFADPMPYLKVPLKRPSQLPSRMDNDAMTLPSVGDALSWSTDDTLQLDTDNTQEPSPSYYKAICREEVSAVSYYKQAREMHRRCQGEHMRVNAKYSNMHADSHYGSQPNRVVPDPPCHTIYTNHLLSVFSFYFTQSYWSKTNQRQELRNLVRAARRITPSEINLPGIYTYLQAKKKLCVQFILCLSVNVSKTHVN